MKIKLELIGQKCKDLKDIVSPYSHPLFPKHIKCLSSHSLNTTLFKLQDPGNQKSTKSKVGEAGYRINTGSII